MSVLSALRDFSRTFYFLACPKKHDKATERRKTLNSDKAHSKKVQHQLLFTNITSVKITTEYVELPNGELIFTKLFQPKDASTAKGMICFSSGFGSHTDWMPSETGIKYAESGFIVFMWEPKGHGRSDGYHVIIEDFHKDLVDVAIWIFNRTINKYIKTNKIYTENIDKHGNYFLSGQSMGGAVTILTALKLQKQVNNPFKGIIVIAPMVGLAPEAIPPKWAIWLLEYLVLPLCPYAKLIPNATNNKCISTDLKLLAKIDDNPLEYCDKLPLITGYNLYKTTLEIENRTNELKLPMLIIHGDADNITDCDRSKQYFENCGCDERDKEFKIYENVGHWPYYEQPKVYTDTIEWMMKRIKSTDQTYSNIKRSQKRLSHVM